jgi:hypothetical protein
MYQAYGIFSASSDRAALLRAVLADAPSTGAAPVLVSIPSATLALLPRTTDDPDASVLRTPDVTVAAIGRPFHRDCPDASRTLAFVRDAYAGERLDALAELFGEYVLFIADPARDRITIASDCLALRPFFYSHQARGIVFGSDVWPLLATGIVPTTVDLDALCSWLCFEHVLGDRSLIADARRVGPSSLLTCSGTGVRETRYATFPLADEPITEDDLLEQVHECVQRTCRHIVSREPRLGCYLSGGFDSRYLACTLTALRNDVDLYTVNYDSREEDVASAVARALHTVPHAISPAASVWDLWDNPFYLAPWGFPAWKFVTTLPVESFGLRHTLVDGLLGDDLIRGYDYEAEITRLAREHGSLDEAIFLAHLAIAPDVLFADTLASRIHARVIRQIRAFRDATPETPERQAYLWLLLNRKNTFHVTNHLHNVRRLETVHPFGSRELLELRLRHPNALFCTRLYRMIFERYYPAVSHIPHSTEVDRRYDRLGAWSRNLVRRVPPAAREVIRTHGDAVFRRAWLLPRLAAYALGMRRQQHLVRFLWPVVMLLDRLREAGLEVAWEEI